MADKRASKKLDWLPNEDQELLLKAALFKNESLYGIWNDVKNISLDNLDPASQRLLPLIYSNLQNHGIDDSAAKRLKFFHRQTFLRNQILSDKAEEILAIFHSADIQTLVLKGLALNRLYYRSSAVRPMADIDLLVKRKNFWDGNKILTSKKWQTGEKKLSLHYEIAPSCQFVDQTDGSELDLHWQIMRDCWNANETKALWVEAIPVNIGDTKTLALSHTHQLFHICWHGARYNFVPPIRWVADAVLILRNAESNIEWDKFVEITRLYRVDLPIYISLKYLKENFVSLIPDKVLSELKNISTSRFQKMAQQFHMTKKTDWTLRRCIKEIIFQYPGLTSSTDLNPKFLVYLKYLQYHLGVSSYWQIPPRFLLQAFQYFVLRQQKM